MEGTVVINNCGNCRKVEKKEVCGKLLKKSAEIWYKSHPRKYNDELELLISNLCMATHIQIYNTGVIRLHLARGHFEEKHSMYFDTLPEQVVKILKEKNV